MHQPKVDSRFGAIVCAEAIAARWLNGADCRPLGGRRVRSPAPETIGSLAQVRAMLLLTARSDTASGRGDALFGRRYAPLSSRMHIGNGGQGSQ